MIWLNGQIVEKGTVSASGAGVALGWGVFTTIGIHDGAPRFLARHIARLERDARAANVPWEIDSAAIRRGVHAVLASNRFQNGLARLTLTKSGDGRWNDDRGADLSILTTETSPSSRDLRVQLSPFRVEARRPLSGIKTTSYLSYLWAWQQAQAAGFDEAILRDGEDLLSEGARSTLFWTKNEALYTPSLETGCLEGIGRDLTLEWAQSADIEVKIGKFCAHEAECAQQIWLISAATGPRSVLSWHDENGVSRAIFSAQTEIGRALTEWFAEQGE